MFTDIALDHVADTGVPDERLDVYFGTIYRSVSTLFRALLNGFSWSDAADALQPINLFWVQWFHFYIAFCAMAALWHSGFSQALHHRASNSQVSLLC